MKHNKNKFDKRNYSEEEIEDKASHSGKNDKRRMAKRERLNSKRSLFLTGLDVKHFNED